MADDGWVDVDPSSLVPPSAAVAATSSDGWIDVDPASLKGAGATGSWSGGASGSWDPRRSIGTQLEDFPTTALSATEHTIMHPVDTAMDLFKSLQGGAQDFANIKDAQSAIPALQDAARTGGTIASAGAGASIGLLGGPFSPLTVPLGAAIGGGLGYVGFDALGKGAASGNGLPADPNVIDKLATATGAGLPLAVIGEGAKIGGPQTKAGIKAKVGQIGKDLGIESSDLPITDPTDPTDSMPPMQATQTTADITGNPKAAMLQKIIGNRNPEYAQAVSDRADAVDSAIKNMATDPEGLQDLAPEDSGAMLAKHFDATEGATQKAASSLYKQIPEDQVPDFQPVVDQMNQVLKDRYGNSPESVPASIQKSVSFLQKRAPVIDNSPVPVAAEYDQHGNAYDESGNPVQENASTPSDGNLLSLQNTRSSLLNAQRMANRAGDAITAGTAGKLADIAQKALEEAPEGSQEWKAANNAYGAYAKVFKNGPLQDLSDYQPSTIVNKIMASPEAATQAKTIFGNNPAAMRTIQDQVIANVSKLKSEAQQLNFINAKQSQLKTLFGDDFDTLDSIRGNIQSRMETERMGNPSKGSDTALKLAVPKDVINGKTTPVSAPNGVFGGALGYGLALAAKQHPIVGGSLAVLGTGLKFLRDRSNGLVQKGLYDALMDPAKMQEAIHASNQSSAIPLFSTTAGAMSPLFAQRDKNGNSRIGVSSPDPLFFSQPAGTSPVTSNKTPDTAIMSQIRSDPYYSALAQTESSFDPKALSKDPNSHAAGLFQFEPATAKALGLQDPYNVAQSFKAVKTLTDQNARSIGSDDPEDLYAAHYLGAPLYNKWKSGKTLDDDDRAKVNFLKQKALPNFNKNYAMAESQTDQS